MSGENNAKALSMGLKKDLGPYATELAEHMLDWWGDENENRIKKVLTEEWDGAVPMCMVGGEVSREIMSVLHIMLDFAVGKAKRETDYNAKKNGMISYHVEPHYDDRSTMTVTHEKTKTLLMEKRRKTYYFDPKSIEELLKEMVEEICEGIELVRKRQNSPFRSDSFWRFS